MTSSIQASIQYIDAIQATVEQLMDEGSTKHDRAQLDIEQFGRSRIPLGGVVQQFHTANLLYLWERATSAALPASCRDSRVSA